VFASIEYTKYFQLATSLASIFYTTAQFAHQIRVLNKEKQQIKTLSMATLGLFIWRSFILGSRILIFILFASLFKYWLFVVVGLHYLLMFVLVFYQLRYKPVRKKRIILAVYSIVTPFIYIFDYCMNWLDGPTRYWYVMCYVPMYCENVLMSALGLWYASTTPTPAWYLVPGCICVIVMFPLGILVQLAYYRFWHLKAPMPIKLVTNRIPFEQSEATQDSIPWTTWDDFRAIVEARNDDTTTRNHLHINPKRKSEQNVN